MAQDINAATQLNLWGKTSDNNVAVEAQRNDLFFIDFDEAIKGIGQVAKLQVKLVPIVPQLVRSVALPEIRVKAEPIRRDSMAYNMPSWDDPLEAIKIVFFLDARQEDDASDIRRFLDVWLALTRAGRGTRPFTYAPGGWLTLDKNYRVDFQFNVYLKLLRGMDTSGLAIPRGITGLRDIVGYNNATLNLLNNPHPLGQNFVSVNYNVLTALANNIPPFAGLQMQVHADLKLYGAWLAAYKISDFTYAESAISTVEATFYADSIHMGNVDEPLEGEASALDQPSFGNVQGQFGTPKLAASL